MSALADRPDDNDDKEKNKLPSFSTQDVSSLPIEKQFAQRLFYNQIQGITLDQAKELLLSLHQLYLNQQYVVSMMAKQEFSNLDGIK